MNKYLIGFVGGVAVSGAVFMPILIAEQDNKFKLGVNDGKITGLIYSVKELEKEFGAFDGVVEYKRLYSVKTSDVVSVEINGVKTVRVIP